MPITNIREWTNCEQLNSDPYGKACVDVARRVMELMDDDSIPLEPHDLICRADNEIGAGGITGFMAGCVANMVSTHHTRGAEFRQAWNALYDVQSESGVVNPAVLTINT